MARRGDSKRNVSKSATREPLTRERVLRAAVHLADEGGIDALSVRKLGQALGVEAMSLYNHVANKGEILDGIADIVVGEMALPLERADWKASMRDRAISVHDVLLRHPWATMLIESRPNLGPARMRYYDAVIGSVRGAGFTMDLAQRVMLTIDSYIYGFTLQELTWAFDWKDSPKLVESFSQQISAADYPHLTEMMAAIAQSSRERGPAAPTRSSGYQAEFEFGLDLVLDGLERVRDAA